jgi:hypothetical protein
MVMQNHYTASTSDWINPRRFFNKLTQALSCCDLRQPAPTTFKTRNARSVTHWLGCFFVPKSAQVLPV